ncbi:MAG TPA: hypothetical protein VFT13_01745 [Candidatus Krumholzibacteria bacterium]|nr:hypothetical protein [Candidatus Krumholzibacteria bacterium]
MSTFESLLEDDELLSEDELEDFDDALFEGIESFGEYDELGERRRRGKSRRPGRVRPGKLPQGRGYVQPRPTGAYATQAQLQAGLARVGKDIRTQGDVIKRVTAQVNKVNSDLGVVNARQDSEILALRKGVKKVDDSSKNQAQLTMLLTLLQKAPELEAKPNLTPEQKAAADVVVGITQHKKQDNTLPLMMMMMGSGGLGGSDNSMNMMLPMLLLLDK